MQKQKGRNICTLFHFFMTAIAYSIQIHAIMSWYALSNISNILSPQLSRSAIPLLHLSTPPKIIHP